MTNRNKRFPSKGSPVFGRFFEMGDLPTFQSRICHPSSAICYLLFAICYFVLVYFVRQQSGQHHPTLCSLRVNPRFLRRIQAGIASVAIGKCSRMPNSPLRRGACPKQLCLCIQASSASFFSTVSGSLISCKSLDPTG